MSGPLQAGVTPKDINSLSDAELSKLIEMSRRAVSKDSSQEDVNTAATWLLSGAGHSTLCVESGSSLFRARRNDPLGPYLSVSDLMAPKRCKLGRACLEGDRVLYVASTMDTAVLEIGAEQGDTVTLVELSSSRQLHLVDFGCTDRCHVGVGDVSWRLKQVFEQGLDRRGWRNQHFIRDFLVSLFTTFVDHDAPNQFRLSAEIATRLMYASGNERLVDGIMYPSVAYLWNSWCAAIADHSFSSLNVNKVMELSIISTEFFPITCFKITGVGQAVSDDIEWEGDHPSLGKHFLSKPESMKGEYSDYLEVSEQEGTTILSRKRGD